MQTASFQRSDRLARICSKPSLVCYAYRFYDIFLGPHGFGAAPGGVQYVCCAQFIVGAPRIRTRDRAFYQAALDYIQPDNNDLRGSLPYRLPQSSESSSCHCRTIIWPMASAACGSLQSQPQPPAHSMRVALVCRVICLSKPMSSSDVVGAGDHMLSRKYMVGASLTHYIIYRCVMLMICMPDVRHRTYWQRQPQKLRLEGLVQQWLTAAGIDISF